MISSTFNFLREYNQLQLIIFGATVCAQARERIMAQELNKSWQCTMCNGVYSTLPILVSHIHSAHSHEPGLCFTCGVDMCPRTFKNTNTYYKHVRNEHGDKYAGDASVASKYFLKIP